MLKVRNLYVSYGDIPALKGVDIDVEEGEIVSVLGPNGAGKTTLLNSISGLVRGEKDSKIYFKDKRIDEKKPEEIVGKGLIQLPEGRKIFPQLTVLENIEVGSAQRNDRGKVKEEVDELFDLFHELKDRKNQLGETLSGGEQQMLAIARALIANPKLLMIDEPSMGLAPVIIQRIFKLIKTTIKDMGITVLLVEQNAHLSLEVSDRAYILSQGEIALQGSVEELKENKQIKETYLGGKSE